MQTGLFKYTTTPALEQVIYFSESRQAALQGNIANISTPNYIARDYDVEGFQAELREAIEEKKNPALFRNPVEEKEGKVHRIAGLADDQRAILRHDNNFLSVETQVTEMQKTYMMHNTALQLMKHQFQLLQDAIMQTR